MDRRGSGFKKILSSYKSLSNYSENKKPVFISEYDCFFLIMQNMNYGTEEDIAEKQNENKKTTKKTTKKILDIIKDNPYINTKEISEIIGNITPDGVRYHINKLKKSGILERISADKGGYWHIK